MQRRDPTWEFLSQAAGCLRTSQEESNIGVQALLLRYLQEIRISTHESSRCLIKDLVAFVAEALTTLATLARALVDCPEVIEYIAGQFDGMNEENSLSDTHDVKKLNDKHRMLR